MTVRTYSSITPQIASQLLATARSRGAVINGSTDTSQQASGTIADYHCEIQYAYYPNARTLNLGVVKSFVFSGDFVLDEIEKNAGLPHVADA